MTATSRNFKTVDYRRVQDIQRSLGFSDTKLRDFFEYKGYSRHASQNWKRTGEAPMVAFSLLQYEWNQVRHKSQPNFRMVTVFAPRDFTDLIEIMCQREGHEAKSFDLAGNADA